VRVRAPVVLKVCVVSMVHTLLDDLGLIEQMACPQKLAGLVTLKDCEEENAPGLGNQRFKFWFEKTGVLPSSKQINSIFAAAGGAALASSPVTMSWTASGTATGNHWVITAVDLLPAAIIPEYPLGLPLLAIFMIVAYGLIRRRIKTSANI
jgi:hypothetical protein